MTFTYLFKVKKGSTNLAASIWLKEEPLYTLTQDMHQYTSQSMYSQYLEGHPC